MSRFHRPNIGSIGTVGLTAEHHTQALVDTFVYELRQQQPLHQTDREFLREYDAGEWALEDVIKALVGKLNRYSPKGYHFGVSESDPTDFGYWPDEEHGRNEGSVEAAERARAEETIAEQTAETLIMGQALAGDTDALYAVLAPTYRDDGLE